MAAAMKIRIGSLKLPQAINATNPAQTKEITNMAEIEVALFFGIVDLLSWRRKPNSTLNS